MKVSGISNGLHIYDYIRVDTHADRQETLLADFYKTATKLSLFILLYERQRPPKSIYQTNPANFVLFHSFLRDLS